MIKVRAAVILVEDDKILLIRHQRDGQTYWTFPGGGVRQGETLVECAAREVMEEAFIQVEVGNLLFCGDTIWPDGRHVVNVFFGAQRIAGSVRKPPLPFPDERLDQPDMIPLSQLSELHLLPDVRAIVESVADGTWAGPIYQGNMWQSTG